MADTLLSYVASLLLLCELPYSVIILFLILLLVRVCVRFSIGAKPLKFARKRMRNGPLPRPVYAHVTWTLLAHNWAILGLADFPYSEHCQWRTLLYTCPCTYSGEYNSSSCNPAATGRRTGQSRCDYWEGSRKSCLLCIVQTGYGPDQASFSACTGGSFSQVKRPERKADTLALG
jgi:hypothetical protein